MALGKHLSYLFPSIGDTEDFVFIAKQTGQSLDTMRNFRFLQCDYTTMKEGYEKTANEFLELASEQRLAILLKVQNEPVKVSIIAKELEATVPEVYRNFDRLVKADLISKNADGSYSITTIGKILVSQISLIGFLSANKKYFKSHDLKDLQGKYIQRIGALENGQHIKGFVKVLEKWKEIYSNANEYISNILYEVPYTPDLIETIAKKANAGVKIRSVFSESAIVSKERKQAFDKLGFKKMIEDGRIERKMSKSVKITVIVNEKEACVMFPTFEGEVDMSEAFYANNDSVFHEWCLDYFNDSWNSAGPFHESKLGKE